MKIERPGLLVGSLAAAVLVIGAFVVWQVSAESDDSADDADVVLEDPQDRSVPDDEFGIEPVPDLEGDAFPEAMLLDAAGTEVSSTSWLGDAPLVINFWFSTCIPCEREMADFAEVDAETGDDVRFIGVNPLDPVPVMERFASERGVEYDLMRDEWAELQTELRVTAFPYTVFVTSEGEIVGQTGVLDADGLRDQVDALLEAEDRA